VVYSISSSARRCGQASVPNAIEGHIIEQVDRADEAPISKLEARGYDPGRAIEPGGMGGIKGAGHYRAIMTPPHPAAHQMPQGKGLEHLSQSGQSGLRSH